MNDHVTIVHKDPSGVHVSFLLAAFVAGLEQFFLHIVNQSLSLICIGSACEDEVIGNDRNALNVDDLYVFAFFLFQCFYCEFYHFL